VRIAQIMAGAPNGGAELFFERMSIALAAAGQDVRPMIREDAGRAWRLREAGLAPQEFRFGGSLDFFTRRKLRAALVQCRAQLAIAWMSRAASHLPEGDWVTAGRLGGYYNLKYYKSCRHLIGNTRGITDWILAQGWPAARVHYLPNFVDDFAATAPASREALGVPEDARLILALGRLHRVKGFDTLIDAAALLPDAHVVIAGEGPERAALAAQISARGVGDRVKLIGWRNDSGALLKAADIFVSSSRHEPLGNMVLEAFSASCPVLAAKAEGPAEVIRDGADGVLVPINDAPALADAARALLADRALQNRLAIAGRIRFMTEFSEQKVVAAWLRFCEQVAG
jgi:glycosyltransferase involved in cell wall biosynthesis